jgi:hypothetical protein
VVKERRYRPGPAPTPQPSGRQAGRVGAGSSRGEVGWSGVEWWGWGRRWAAAWSRCLLEQVLVDTSVFYEKRPGVEVEVEVGLGMVVGVGVSVRMGGRDM